MAEHTTGQVLDALRQRAGMSLRAVAQAAGYSTASGVQRYFDASFDKALSLDVARRLAGALAGAGQPPIAETDVMALAGLPAMPNAIPFKMEGASVERMREDLPIYGTALGAERKVDGEAIEQTTLNKAEVVQYAKRPVLLNGNSAAYGLYVAGSSMDPRFADGETILVDPKGRFRPGDDVVVYLRPTAADLDDGEAARAVLVKRLVRRTAAYVELQQFTPPATFQIPAGEVVSIHRVIPWGELLA